jgi:hypothetical protein
MVCKDALINQASRCGFAYNTVYVGICTFIDENGTALSSHQEVTLLDAYYRCGSWRFVVALRVLL